MTKTLSLLLMLIFSALSSNSFCQLLEVQYGVIALSHNDYLQEFPITNAINHGFKSLEVDIISDGDLIRVSHNSSGLDKKKLFEKSYLIPLIEKTKNFEKEILLFIDVKKYDKRIIKNLNEILEKYKQNIVTRNDENEDTRKRIKIILSGDIPRAQIIENEKNKFLFVDGRIEDLDKELNPAIMPLISAKLADFTRWKGRRKPSKKTVEKINKIVKRAHDNGFMIRFWKSKENERMLKTLAELKVDIIGVDDIPFFYNTMRLNKNVSH